MKTIGAFVSANNLAEVYTNAIHEMGTLIAERGFALSFGGAKKGAMKTLADAVLDADGQVIGFTCPIFSSDVNPRCTEIIEVEDVHALKKGIVEKADAVVMLPGGIGTLDEFISVAANKDYGTHSKPLVLLNTNGLYTPLLEQLQKMEAEGFLRSKLDDLLHMAETPSEVLDYIEQQLTS